MQPALFNIEGLKTEDPKPVLKWAGGKRWLLPKLLPLWERYSHCRLVEPFVGGMAIALGLLAERALLNDTNPHVINLYQWMQRGLVTDIAMEYNKDLYYEYRDRFNHLVRTNKVDSVEAASIFYYMNRSGFNGLCRFNSKGEFNVPFGRYKTVNYMQDFTPYQAVLAPWEFTLGDFSEIELAPDDFVYADPPYDVDFTSYSAGGFSWDDQQRLAEWLALHEGPVVASNQATDRILDLYRSLGFDIGTLPAPRMISCNGDRTPALEMLATKGI
jgi:DNA adenine methylase